MYWLSHSATQDVILEKQKGATRQALTKSQIEAMQIPTISLARQRQIVTDLDVLKERIDEGLVTYAEGVQLFEAAMPAVLDKAFRGEM
jgi:type I restriction enzyme S subunit